MFSVGIYNSPAADLSAHGSSTIYYCDILYIIRKKERVEGWLVGLQAVSSSKALSL